MPDAERTALLIRLAERISIANRLMPIAQRKRFPNAKHPPTLCPSLRCIGTAMITH